MLEDPPNRQYLRRLVQLKLRNMERYMFEKERKMFSVWSSSANKNYIRPSWVSFKSDELGKLGKITLYTLHVYIVNTIFLSQLINRIFVFHKCFLPFSAKPKISKKGEHKSCRWMRKLHLWNKQMNCCLDLLKGFGLVWKK